MVFFQLFMELLSPLLQSSMFVVINFVQFQYLFFSSCLSPFLTYIGFELVQSMQGRSEILLSLQLQFLIFLDEISSEAEFLIKNLLLLFEYQLTYLEFLNGSLFAWHLLFLLTLILIILF